MKKIIILTCFVIMTAGCNSIKDNPDKMFDEFYQGSPAPSTFSIEEDKGIPSKNISEDKSFTVSGENSDYSCTTTCQPK